MSAPAWFLDALRDMKATGRSGVVVVVPKDGYLIRISQSLQQLVASDTPSLRALRRRAVFVFVPKDLLPACLPDVEEGKTLVTLDADGRVLNSVEADLAEALIPASFTRRVGRLLGKRDVESDAPPRALPYGVEWAEGSHRDLFGTAYDPCPPCGRPRIDNDAARMIKYLRLLGT